MPPDFAGLYVALDAHVQAIDQRYLSQYFPADPTVGPEEYELDVRAYCLLCHAAIEQFVEDVALELMNDAIGRWLAERRYGATLAAATAYFNASIVVDDDETRGETRLFDYLRPHYDEIKRRFSNLVHENHGVSPKYLRHLMVPVGIDIRDDVRLRQSLSRLASSRGQFAHKHAASIVLSPEDARAIVEDCLELCQDLRDKAQVAAQ